MSNSKWWQFWKGSPDPTGNGPWEYGAKTGDLLKGLTKLMANLEEFTEEKLKKHADLNSVLLGWEVQPDDILRCSGERLLSTLRSCIEHEKAQGYREWRVLSHHGGLVVQGIGAVIGRRHGASNRTVVSVHIYKSASGCCAYGSALSSLPKGSAEG